MENEGQKTKKQVILGWAPPANVYMPSPAMSVLKAYLQNFGYNVCIEYWNLYLRKLQNEFMWSDGTLADEGAEHLLLYYNYLAIKHKDTCAYNRLKVLLKAIKPQYINMSPNFWDEHMHQYAQKFEDLLNEIIDKYDFDKILYFGLEVNLYQWVCSSIIAEKIKEKNPSAVIVVGGIGTKEAAIAYLQNFAQFDIAMWGEGEIPLLHLTEKISEDKTDELSSIGNIAYRVNGEILTSRIPNMEFADLSSKALRPDYSDFFDKMDCYGVPKQYALLSFENSRSCHWKKCHFCYLNMGYKFRKKDIAITLDEIADSVKKYGIYRIQFLDNDLIDNDFARFDAFLDGLMEIREQYPRLSIDLGEIISHGVNARIVKKMALAGFNHVQIGYESPSDNLLRKIDKKNTFSSNLLFIKFAYKYRIHVNGANVLRGLIEETEDDIIESIDNLHFLRFFYAENFFKHNISQLAVIKSSPYYNKIKDELPYRWAENPMSMLLPRNYLQAETKIILLEHLKLSQNLLWDKFIEIEHYYKSQHYSYLFVSYDDKAIYKEYCNGTLINELEFDTHSTEWNVLQKANEEVISLAELAKECHIEEKSLIPIIDGLFAERLIFHSSDYSEIVSVVDISTSK